MYPAWHEERMSRSRSELWNLPDPLSLEELIDIPEEWKNGTVRCRIVYGTNLESVTFHKYDKQPVNSLRLVECNDIDYHLKKTDRSMLNDLFSRREGCDEIIIIRNGLVTDTSISNLIFFDGEKWVTPSTPLLEGTCRQRLLYEGKISEAMILVENLEHFCGFMFINAMRPMEEEKMIPMKAIKG